MFQTQARTERYDATKAFNECKMIKGTSVSDHVMKMKRHMDHLEWLGHPVPLQLATDTILNSLSEDYKPFVINYNMNNMEKTIAELRSMLKTDELNMGTKNKTKDMLMVRDGGVKKKHGHGSTSKGKGPVQAFQSVPKVRENGKGKGKGKKVKPNKARTENRCFTCNEVGHWRQNCAKRHEAGRNHSSTQQLRKVAVQLYIFRLGLRSTVILVSDRYEGSTKTQHLNHEALPANPVNPFHSEASSSRIQEQLGPSETIVLSSDDEFISDDYSTPPSSARSPPSNSPRSEGENYPDISVNLNRDGRLNAVIEQLESTRVKIPLRTSWDSEFAYLSQEEFLESIKSQEELDNKEREAFLSTLATRKLAFDFVEEDDEISDDPLLAQKAALKVFNRRTDEQAEEVNKELDWCRDRLHLRKHRSKISGVHLRRTRGKRGAPGKTWITVKRSGVKDVEHTLDKLDRYNLSEWNEIRNLLPKANKNYRAEVEEVIDGLIARIRRTTEILDVLLQPPSALPKPHVRRSTGTSTRRFTPCVPRTSYRPLDLSMLDLSFPSGVTLSEGQVIREPVHGICVGDNLNIPRFQRFSELHKAPTKHLVTVLFTANNEKKNKDAKEFARAVRSILNQRIANGETFLTIQIKEEEPDEDSDS
ncbi:hypothetical protein OSB04_024854 [Centaurea solstitialis]|uniref:CCHC-type domain-containing protein n=1 Tax=Centaurea solstitialis TaxID=347529 RepID=A0AA38W3H5_9ASTR|nr:hypothetical protein OSB04_024854 [Centaurea solstitialis]